MDGGIVRNGTGCQASLTGLTMLQVTAKSLDLRHYATFRDISLPHREISFNSTEPLDKSKLYVCYWAGIGCNASTKTALKLLTLGFQVRELIGGLNWWKRGGYATHGAGSRTETEIKCGC